MKYFLFYMTFFYSALLIGGEDLLRCNKKQSICELQNKRITIGDRVGIFSPSGLLVAIGKVTDLKGSLRVVKMEKRYNKILKTHRAQIITDKEAKRPKKYFKIKSHLKNKYIAGNIGFQSMGVGNGFTGTDIRGQYHVKWKGQTYFLLGASYLTGSGTASAKLLDISQTSLELSVLGVTGGFSHIFRPYDEISFRGTIEGGLGLASVTLGTEGDVGEVLNNRIVDGTVTLIRAEVSIGYRLGNFVPTVGINFLMVHNSNNFGFSAGVITSI